MNGKLPANSFTCPQGYLRPNILYYQGGPEIQQQNQAVPGVPFYIIPSESFSPYLTGFGCTDTTAQKGVPKSTVNVHANPPKTSEPIPIPAAKRPYAITKYDWYASSLVFSEKPYSYELEKLTDPLAMLNGEKINNYEDEDAYAPRIRIARYTKDDISGIAKLMGNSGIIANNDDDEISETPDNKK